MVQPVRVIPIGKVFPCVSPSAFGAIFGGGHSDLCLAYQVVELKGFCKIGIPDEPMILDSDILEALANLLEQHFTLLKDVATPEYTGVRLHDPLHGKAHLGGSVFAGGPAQAVKAGD